MIRRKPFWRRYFWHGAQITAVLGLIYLAVISLIDAGEWPMPLHLTIGMILGIVGAVWMITLYVAEAELFVRLTRIRRPWRKLWRRRQRPGPQ